MNDVAHNSIYLSLLPSGPDEVHRLILHIIHINTPYGMIIYFFYPYYKSYCSTKANHCKEKLMNSISFNLQKRRGRTPGRPVKFKQYQIIFGIIL